MEVVVVIVDDDDGMEVGIVMGIVVDETNQSSMDNTTTNSTAPQPGIFELIIVN